jgi:hypothetical protein
MRLWRFAAMPQTKQMYDPVEVCRYCGGTDRALTGGDGLVLESIEYAEP